MKIAIAFAAAGLLALPAVARLAPLVTQDVAKVGAKIPAFTASAVALVDSHDVKVPTAYMIIGVGCGSTPAYQGRYKAVEDEFRAKGVDFVWVFPNKTETLEAKQAWMKKMSLKGPMIDDVGAVIAQALECQNTAQAILTDAKGNIVFRGGIDDSTSEASVTRRHLAEAIKEVLAGKPVSVTTSKVPG
jgi:hypothetical protein